MKKKLVVGMMVLTTVLAITACGKDNAEKTGGADKKQENVKSTQSDETDDTEETKSNKDKKNADKNELSQEALLERDETAADEFYYEIEDDGVHIIRYEGKSEIVVIPAQIEGKDVVKIEKAFTYLSSVKGVVIPETVQVLGLDAFSVCSSLETVVIKGNGLTLIDARCFINCENLKNINLPDSLQSIASLAFCGCKSLTQIDIPETVEYDRDSVFAQSGILE